MSEEANDVELVPSGDKSRDAFMQEAIQLLLRTAKMLVSASRCEMVVDMPQASSVVMSVLATTTMLYVRGYPQGAPQIMQFKELGEYFQRLGMEEEFNMQQQEGEPDDTSASTSN